MKKLSSLLLTLSLGFILPAQGASLFKDYQYGASYEEFSEDLGYYDCTQEIGANALCLEVVPFVGHEFEMALVFNQQRLTSVSLFTDFDNDLHAKVMGALAKNFTLVALQGQDAIFDLITEAKSSSNAATYGANLNNFEVLQLSNGQLSYVFLEQTESALSKVNNATQAALSLPKGQRGAELIVMEDDEADTFLLINFTSPRLEIERQEQLMAEPTEDF